MRLLRVGREDALVTNRRAAGYLFYLSSNKMQVERIEWSQLLLRAGKHLEF